MTQPELIPTDFKPDRLTLVWAARMLEHGTGSNFSKASGKWAFVWLNDLAATAHWPLGTPLRDRFSHLRRNKPEQEPLL